jgi:MFS family permease
VTQVGCALALVLLVPIGDLANRKSLIGMQLLLLLLLVALAVVAFASSTTMLLIGMAGVGMLGTAMTQGLIAYAATITHESERGRVVGAAQSGVVIGILMARSLAGVVADLAGWRSVYITSGLFAALMCILEGHLRVDHGPSTSVSLVSISGQRRSSAFGQERTFSEVGQMQSNSLRRRRRSGLFLNMSVERSQCTRQSLRKLRMRDDANRVKLATQYRKADRSIFDDARRHD